MEWTEEEIELDGEGPRRRDDSRGMLSEGLGSRSDARPRGQGESASLPKPIAAAASSLSFASARRFSSSVGFLVEEGVLVVDPETGEAGVVGIFEVAENEGG